MARYTVSTEDDYRRFRSRRRARRFFKALELAPGGVAVLARHRRGVMTVLAERAAWFSDYTPSRYSDPALLRRAHERSVDA